MILALSGCTLNLGPGTGSNSNNTTDGGVFRSLNKGANWEQKALIQTINRPRNFAGVNIISLNVDPSDNKAIYAGSSDSGLYYSYDSANSWQIATGLGKVRVTDVAVDPFNKCVIYAAVENKVMKSEDCSRNWAQVYFDNDLAVKITTLAIDYLNSANIFIGTSRGDIIKSSDRGGSWRAIARFDSRVDKLSLNPAEVKIMFAGTSGRGIFRSTDGGNEWQSLTASLKDFSNNFSFRDIAMIKSEKSTVFLATNYGLLKSTDGGSSWSEIKLLTPEKEAKINSIAVNSLNGNEIYYVTNTTFYRSLDGGKNWSSKKLPTGRAGAKLLLDPKNYATLYLAAKSVK